MAVTLLEPARREALRVSASNLSRWARYQLPPGLDQRILDLGERKASLTDAERAEYLPWVEFTQQRSADKLAAEAALLRLTEAFPEVAASPE